MPVDSALLAELGRATWAITVVRLVRGVHHDPTAARTPIGHVRENLSVIFRAFVSDHKTRWPGRYWGKTETETTISGFRSLIENAESKN